MSRLRRNRRLQGAAELGLVVLAPVLVALTYALLGPMERGPSDSLLRGVLLADFIYVLVVAGLVITRVVQLVLARRAQSAGSRLHLRLTAVFTFLALLPTVLVAIFAMLSINIGLEGWFSDRVRNVLGSSLQAAEAYAQEHRQELSRDAEGLAAYLNLERQRSFFMDDGEIRQALGRVQAQVEYVLAEAFVIDGLGDIRARGARSYEFDFERPDPAQIRAATDGILLIEDWENNEFRALIKLDAFEDRYLLATRRVDGNILSLLDETQESYQLYQQLEQERGRLLFEFGLIYIGFAVILVLGAIWLALWFAERLSQPVGRLVTASQKVGEGDLSVRVREEDGDDEIALLGRNFNSMTARLNAQREELLTNTRQIEDRRRLFDSVLSSVTSGVVGLDAEGRVTFVNRSARRLLDVTGAESQAISAAVPEFGPLFDTLRSGGKRRVQEQVNLIRSGNQETLLVRMSPRYGASGIPEGYVVAFDDVTDLVSAQRMAAWGDVARRIAHEIKNPLTPIQLSAERIKRKFKNDVQESEKLEQMTDVIVRQTEDLRRIVDEFSKFARMPEPDQTRQDLAELLRGAVTLQEAGQPEVRFVAEIPEGPVWASLDATMITQALTNLLKNGGEAIESRVEKGVPEGFQPELRIVLTTGGDMARITVSDNGIGLPEDRAKLFEPYVTTRDKGTGLGLPIVKKIIEEHGGALALVDAEPFGSDNHRGAMAAIDLPCLKETGAQGAPEEAEWATS
ncbi:MAG: PAS domain-containing sensor histidine kinase [Proteobacteria bacterium]|nr:MAG: PAS domain-containing sensor histidine kinase [Pseudomonadota bacterium]